MLDRSTKNEVAARGQATEREKEEGDGGAGGRFLAGLPKLPPEQQDISTKKRRMAKMKRCKKKCARVRARNEWTCKYARGRFLGKGGASLLFAPLLPILTGIDSSCRTGPESSVAAAVFSLSRHRRPNRLVSGGLSNAEVAPVFRRASSSFPLARARSLVRARARLFCRERRKSATDRLNRSTLYGI